jgi:predicted nucleic acid-binding protein
MNILVDTSIWSLAFRRKPADLNSIEQSLVQELSNLIQEGRAQLLGPVRQEVLSGIRNPDQFEKLRLALRPFRDEPLGLEDYETAAMASNRCRAKGIAMSAVDALLCAVALRKNLSIFTTDSDFKDYSRILPLKVHPHRSIS